ncbi:MAG TPA: TolC family protein [Chitinophagaceae bacterium]|nr:TolC family protein [Chitinophagaceae bacterium]
MKNFLLACVLVSSALGVHAQDTWDLRRCVEYAIANNISVKQADVNARVSQLRSKLARAEVFPNISFNTSGGLNFGRSIDPTSNQYTTNSVFFQSYNLNAGITLFNFFRIRNDRKAAEANFTAAEVNLAAARNSISLNVAASYLQYLLSIETTNAAKLQIQQTTAQLNNTRKLVDAGSMPELNAAQLEAQLATDSSTYITDKGLEEQNRIALMGMLNLDASTSFQVSVPDVDKIPLEPFSELQPDYVYKLALATQPQQRFDSLSIVAQNFAIKSARASMYPTLSGFAQLGSNYASTFRQLGGYYSTGKYDTLGVVPVNGTNYYALTPGIGTYTVKPSYWKQVGEINFSQAFGVQLNVPLWSNRQLKNNYEQSKLTLENLKLTQQQNNITLQTNVYQAYSSSVSALEKYNATVKAYEIDNYAFELASKRYGIGVLSTIDYITTQNNMFKAKIDQLSAHYDYVFKMKILEFYKGRGVKL